MHAAFLWSGLGHEFVWLLGTVGVPGSLSPDLGWLFYFLLQAPIVTVERIVDRVSAVCCAALRRSPFTYATLS